MTQTIRQFSQLNVTTKKSFIGDKIPIEEVLEKELTVESYKVTDSTKKPGTDCLNLQIILEGKPRIIFTSSTFLMDQLEQVPKDAFPFLAKIIRVNRHFEFK